MRLSLRGGCGVDRARAGPWPLVSRRKPPRARGRRCGISAAVPYWQAPLVRRHSSCALCVAHSFSLVGLGFSIRDNMKTLSGHSVSFKADSSQERQATWAGEGLPAPPAFLQRELRVGGGTYWWRAAAAPTH